MVFDGTVRNALAVIGILAAAAHRSASPQLRAVDTAF
jgi:ADP-ribose pyrophosphatase